MEPKKIYIIDPVAAQQGRVVIGAYEIDLDDFRDFMGLDKGGDRWYDDEMSCYILSRGIESTGEQAPVRAWRQAGLTPPWATYSAAGAARALGISRKGFLDRLKNHPLEKSGLHDGEVVYRWDDLRAWDASIPNPGRPKG